MDSFEREQARQQEAAARRVKRRTPEHSEHETLLAQPGAIARADTPERIAKRTDRLSRHHAREDAMIERIINTTDFVGIRYLDAGVAAARDRAREHPRRERPRPGATAPARSCPPSC